MTGARRRAQSTGFCDVVAIALPCRERAAHAFEDRHVIRRGCEVQDGVPRGRSVAAFDASMNLREREVFEREAVVLDQRMFGQRRFRTLGCAIVELASVPLGALDKKGRDRGGRRPAACLDALIEIAPIVGGIREKLDALKARQIHPESARVFKEQLRVRTPA